jgi:protease IV
MTKSSALGPRTRSRRPPRRSGVLRTAAALSLLLPTTGCFVSLGTPLGAFRGERPLEEKTIEGEGRAKILLMRITGAIDDEPQEHAFGLIEEESTVSRVRAELEKAKDDDRVKAVLLRIDSPGGGVTASDEVYQEIVRFKRERKIPVVAALGDLAASGGYYVACAADRIVAHPTTVTGSIGVILVNLNIEGLLGKIGVRNETFKAGEHKDLLSPLRAPTPEERRIVQSILDSLHARFIAIVREGRPRLDVARLPELTDGRIFDATQALGAGLVDEVGDLHAAIDAAKAAAHVDEARIVTYYRRPDETRENIYSVARGMPPQVNLLAVDTGLAGRSGPRFMYLWAPALAE